MWGEQGEGGGGRVLDRSRGEGRRRSHFGSESQMQIKGQVSGGKDSDLRVQRV